MEGILRKIAIWICTAIYKLIPSVYNMFFKFANGQFFTDDTISKISSNIYVLVSVVMLFAFSVTILSAIVNPDLLTDNKKGVAAVFKRAIFGLVLIVMMPILFNEAYSIQNQVLEKGLIEKIVVGISYDKNTKAGANGGQVIAGSLLGSILYPVDENISVEAVEDVSEIYGKMIAEDIDYIDRFSKSINITTDGDVKDLSKKSTNYAFEFNGLVAIIAGGVCVYILLLFAIDTAIRMVKLSFLELTAPISIVSYIAMGDDIFKRWTKEVGKTYADVFIRIVCISFYILLVSKLDGFIDSIDGGLITKVVLIVGLLIFVKQLPDFINSIFGTNMQFKGGIGGRLGQMAAVGNIAKDAWGKVTKAATTAALTAGGIGAGVATLGAGGAALGALGFGLARHGWNHGFESVGARPGRETATGQVLRRIGGGFRAANSYLQSGNPIRGISDARNAYRETDVSQETRERRNRLNRNRIDNAAGLNPAGRMRTRDANGNVTDDVINPSDPNAVRDAELNVAGLDNDAKGNRRIRNIVDALVNKGKYQRANKVLEDMQSNNEKIDNLLKSFYENSEGDVKATFSNLRMGYNEGKISLGQLSTKIKSMIDSGVLGEDESANEIIKTANKITSSCINADKDVQKMFGAIIEKDATGNIVKINANKIKSTATDAGKILNSYNENYEAEKSKIKDDDVKDLLKIYEGDYEAAASEYSRVISGATKSYSKGTAPSTSNSGSTTSGGQSSTSSSGSTTSGGQSSTSNGSSTTSGGQSSVNNSGEVSTESVQQVVERTANVHEAPTHEEHNNRYDDLVSAFGANFDSASNNTGSNSSNSVNVNTPDLSPYFDNLSQTIKDTSSATNDILSKQLDKQEEAIKSTNKGFSDLNSSINAGFTKVNSNLNKVNNNLKSVDNNLENLDSSVRNSIRNNSNDKDDE